MEFFTIGNFIVLGITGMSLFLFRQLDKRSRSNSKLEQYVNELKEELAVFLEEKEAAVKDYGTILDVHQKSAKELMRRLQITDEDMKLKAAAVAKIDERITAYDEKLEELVRMTIRVQENLNRIREENAFVEKVNKLIAGTKEKFEAVEQELGAIERRFQAENASSLEKISAQVLEKVSAKADELRTLTDDAERRMAEVSERIEEDFGRINTALEDSLERAAKRADKLENDAVVRLREQAVARIEQLQTNIEEDLKEIKENSDVKLAEIQEIVSQHKENWNTDLSELENQREDHKSVWKQDIADIDNRLKVQKESWEEAERGGNASMQSIVSELANLSQSARDRFIEETSAMEERIKSVQDDLGFLVTSLKERLTANVKAIEDEVSFSIEDRFRAWTEMTNNAEYNTKNLISELETSSLTVKESVDEEITAMGERLKLAQEELASLADDMKDRLTGNMKSIETDVVSEMKKRLSELENSSLEVKEHFSAETYAMEDRLKALRNELEATANDIKENLTDNLKTVEEQVISAMDDRLKTWMQATERAESNTQKSISDLEKYSLEVKSSFAAALGETDDRIKALDAEIEEKGGELRQYITDSSSSLQKQVAESMDERISAWKDKAEDESQRVQEALANTEKLALETQERISKEISDTIKQFELNKIKIEELKSHIEKEIAIARENASLQAEKELEKWKSSVEAEDAKAQELLSRIETALEDMKGRISHEISTASERISSFQEKLEKAEVQIQEQIAKVVSDAQEVASLSAAEELEKWKRAAEERDISAREMISEMDKSIENAKERISQEASAINAHFGNLNAELEGIARRIEAETAQAVTNVSEQAFVQTEKALEKWKEMAADEEAKLKSAIDNLEASFGGTKQELTDKISETLTQFEDINFKVNESAITIENTMTEAMQNARDKALELAKEEFERWKETIDSAGRSFSERSETELEKWRTAIEREDVKIQELLFQLEKLAKDTERSIQDSSDNAKEQFEDIQAEIKNTVEHIKGVMASAVKQAEEKALSLTDTGLEKWKKAAEEGDAKARKLFEDIDNASKEAKTYISSELNLSTERLEEIKAGINETALRIEEIMAQAVSQAEEKANALTDNGLEKWKKAAEESDAQARKLFEDLEKTSTETKQYVFDEIASAKGQFEGLKGEIAEVAGRIEAEMLQAVSKAEEKAAELTGINIERWKEIISEEGNKTEKLINDLKHASHEEMQKLATIEERLKSISEETERKAAEDAELQLEKCRQAVHESDANIRQMFADLESFCIDTKKYLLEEIAPAKDHVENIYGKIDEAVSLLDSEMSVAMNKARERALLAAEAEEDKLRILINDLETSCTDTKKRLFDEIESAESRIKDIQDKIDSTYSHIEDELVKAAGEAENQALIFANAGLEKWRNAVDEEGEKVKELLASLEGAETEHEERTGDLKKRIADLQLYADESMQTLKIQIENIARSTEQKALEDMDARLERWKDAAVSQDSKAQELLTTLEHSSENMEQRIHDMQGSMDNAIANLESHLMEKSALMERKILEEIEAKIEEHRMTQDAQFKRLESLADDASGIDTELRRHISEIENRLKEDFSNFERSFTEDCEKVTAEFSAAAQILKNELEAVGHELSTIKSQAFDNVTEQFREFERNINEDLAMRSSSIEERLTAWQESLRDELKNKFSERYDQIISEMDVLKSENANFIADTLKQSQESLENQIKEFADQAMARNNDVAGLIESSKQELDEWQAVFSAELQKAESSINDAGRRVQDFLVESDERLNIVRESVVEAKQSADNHKEEFFAYIDEGVKSLDVAIKDIDKHIKDFTSQTRLFERTDELKAELERRLEELGKEFEIIDERREEALKLEEQLVKIKRLEDDVNTKMTRFLSEKHKIEQMEKDFTRFIEVSERVEEKLTEVSNSDDTLQEIQVQIRRINDSLDKVEEKYQRIEKKNQALNETNDGIDKNFKALREAENATQQIVDKLGGIVNEIGTLQVSVDTLTTNNAKAREVADKLSLLDKSLSDIEDRIESMQRARVWVAEAETRLEELNKQMLAQVRMMDSNAPKSSGGKISDNEKGAPPLSKRENVSLLARQGWTSKEIARTMKISQGEVELILEFTKDKD